MSFKSVYFNSDHTRHFSIFKVLPKYLCKRASSRVEEGTSGFLSISDSVLRIPAELGQESQASYSVEK